MVDPTNGEIVPLGASGELMIRGSCVMHGYWDDPEKTRQAICQARWYRTGYVQYLLNVCLKEKIQRPLTGIDANMGK